MIARSSLFHTNDKGLLALLRKSNSPVRNNGILTGVNAVTLVYDISSTNTMVMALYSPDLSYQMSGPAPAFSAKTVIIRST